MSSSKPYLFIINPASGSGQGQKAWTKIKALLEEKGIPFHFQFTRQTGDGTTLAREAIANGYREIQVVGGDGHFREVATAVLEQQHCASSDVALTLFTAGTGNDVVKSFELPIAYTEALDAMLHGHTRLLDAGLLECGDGSRHYFTNFGGVGFDSFVVEQTAGLKRMGAIAYLAGTLLEMFRFKKPVMRIKADSYSYEGETLMLIAGNGRYSGSGMLLVPGAKPDDGLLFVTVVKSLHPLKMLWNFRKIYTGNFLTHPQVESFAASAVEVELLESDFPLRAQADGDITDRGPWKFSILPEALLVRTSNPIR